MAHFCSHSTLQLVLVLVCACLVAGSLGEEQAKDGKVASFCSKKGIEVPSPKEEHDQLVEAEVEANECADAPKGITILETHDPNGAVGWAKRASESARRQGVKDAFVKKSCPKDCSQHGMCRYDGVCVCDNGYSGADCAQSTTETRDLDKDFDKYGEGTVFFRMFNANFLHHNAKFYDARPHGFDNNALLINPGRQGYETLFRVPGITTGNNCLLGTYAIKITMHMSPMSWGNIYVGVSDSHTAMGYKRQYGNNRALGSAFHGKDKDNTLDNIQLGGTGGPNVESQSFMEIYIGMGDSNYIFARTDDLTAPVVWKPTAKLDCTQPLSLVVFGHSHRHAYRIYGISVEVKKSTFFGAFLTPDEILTNPRMIMTGYSKENDNAVMELNPWQGRGKLITLPLLPRDVLSKGAHSIRITVSAQNINPNKNHPQNSLYAAIGDGSQSIGHVHFTASNDRVFRSWNGGRKYLHNHHGHSDYRWEGSASGSSPHDHNLMESLFMIRGGTDSVVGKTTHGIDPASDVNIPKSFSMNKPINLVLYSDSRWVVYGIDIKVRREGIYQGVFHKHLDAYWLARYASFNADVHHIANNQLVFKENPWSFWDNPVRHDVRPVNLLQTGEESKATSKASTSWNVNRWFPGSGSSPGPAPPPPPPPPPPSKHPNPPGAEMMMQTRLGAMNGNVCNRGSCVVRIEALVGGHNEMYIGLSDGSNTVGFKGFDAAHTSRMGAPFATSDGRWYRTWWGSHHYEAIFEPTLGPYGGVTHKQHNKFVMYLQLGHDRTGVFVYTDNGEEPAVWYDATALNPYSSNLRIVVGGDVGVLFHLYYIDVTIMNEGYDHHTH